MKQKDVFLQSEADAWFSRNSESANNRDFTTDPICQLIMELGPQRTGNQDQCKLLEVGCGEGRRLSWIKQQISADVYGIEPSGKAVEKALELTVNAAQGTADKLPYDDGMFDILVFGFCLYLCDIDDLFKIAYEADRVLKSEGWLIIHDFHADMSRLIPYHHKPGIFSHKMDFAKLFDWHPSYHCHSFKLCHHMTDAFTDESNYWGALSLLRKCSIRV